MSQGFLSGQNKWQHPAIWDHMASTAKAVGPAGAGSAAGIMNLRAGSYDQALPSAHQSAPPRLSRCARVFVNDQQRCMAVQLVWFPCYRLRSFTSQIFARRYLHTSKYTEALISSMRLKFEDRDTDARYCGLFPVGFSPPF